MVFGDERPLPLLRTTSRDTLIPLMTRTSPATPSAARPGPRYPREVVLPLGTEDEFKEAATAITLEHRILWRGNAWIAAFVPLDDHRLLAHATSCNTGLMLFETR